MLLNGLSFIRKLEVLSDAPSGYKCILDCEDCLVRKVKDALEAEFEVADQCRIKGILSKEEFDAVMLDFIRCNCQLCYDFGCSCTDDACIYERFGVVANVTTATNTTEIIKFPGVTL